MLNLEGNKYLGIEGNVKVAMSLKSNVCLTDLKIDWALLPFTITVKVLSFNHNAYQPTELRFRKSGLKDDEVKLLCAAMKNNKSVKVLK